MKKVLVSDALSDRGLDILRKSGKIEVFEKPKITAEELLKEIGQYDALVVRSRTKVTKDVLAAAKNLKVIGRAGSGVDNIDVTESTRRGVVVMNTPGGNTVTTAEHTVSMMMALARQIPQAHSSTKAGKWERGKFMGVELTGKTLGIIGTGNIGTVVADRAQGLKMSVIAYDPYVTAEIARKRGFEKVELDELYARADFISIHTPLLDSTKNLVNAQAFAKMKDGVRLINCARGGLVNEKDLYDAIQSGKVAGAALDVFEKEPPSDNPLVGLDQVIVTCHLGASTEEAQENVATAVAEQLVDYLVHGVIRNAVNFPSLTPEQAANLGPYVTLGEKLGSMIAQICADCIEDVVVEYSGEVTRYEIKPITLAVVKGFLAPIEKEGVNYVNAVHIATERGIRIDERKTTETHDFTSMIKLTTKSKAGTKTLAGVLFGQKHARIVRLDDFYFELNPDGYVLMITNKDVPGVVGHVGMTLGAHNVNIAGLSLSRENAGGTALSLINVDSDVPDAVLKEIRGLKGVVSARLLRL